MSSPADCLCRTWVGKANPECPVHSTESEASHYAEDGPVADSDDGYKITQAEQEREMCPRCNGSGEGQYEGTKCSRCGGSGELLTEDEEEEKAAKWDREHDERSDG